MNKRIRYIKTQTGFESGQFIKAADGKEYKAVLKDTYGEIISIAEKKAVFEMNASSPHKIKIAIKDALIELGCEFEPEIRKKRGDVNETGQS